jgi:drug/metabolite transporter (DMT)-like permease
LSNGYLKYLVPYVVIQSFSYGFAKSSLTYASPFVFMGIRYLIASTILLVISRRFIFNKYVVAMAACSSASTLTWILALEYVSPGDSAVLNFTMPLFAIPLAIFFVRENPRVGEVAGASIGFTGVLVYSSTLSHGSETLGVLLSLASALFLAGLTLLFRKTNNVEPASLVGSQYLIGAAPFLVGSIFFPDARFVQGFFVDLSYLSILGGAVQLFLWNSLVKTERIGRVTTMTFAIPALTVLVQTVETQILPSAIAVLGGLLMFIGIYVATATRFASVSWKINPEGYEKPA